MAIATEQIGSIPRPAELLHAMRAHASGQLSDEKSQAAQDAALRETILVLKQQARLLSAMANRRSRVSRRTR